MVRIMGRRIKIGLLWKMAFVALIIAAIYDLYFTYYALPRFQSMIVHDQEAKAQQRAEVVLGMLTPTTPWKPLAWRLEQKRKLTLSVPWTASRIPKRTAKWPSG